MQISFSQIKQEILSFQWLLRFFKNNPKWIVFISLLGVFGFIFKDIPTFNRHTFEAIMIYPEVLANVEEFRKKIDKRSDPSYITSLINEINRTGSSDNFDKLNMYDTSHDNFDTHYTGFNKHYLDIQIGNFYENIKKDLSDYELHDLEALADQGNSVLEKLNYYFGCENPIKQIEEQKKVRYNIISQDSTRPTFSVVHYLRYRFK